MKCSFLRPLVSAAFLIAAHAAIISVMIVLSIAILDDINPRMGFWDNALGRSSRATAAVAAFVLGASRVISSSGSRRT